MSSEFRLLIQLQTHIRQKKVFAKHWLVWLNLFPSRSSTTN